jgi:hypothetical protein
MNGLQTGQRREIEIKEWKEGRIAGIPEKIYIQIKGKNGLQMMLWEK